MAINVMSTGYYPTGYTNNKTTKAETGTSFADIVNQKAAEADKAVVQEKTSAAFDTFGANAPDEVRHACKEVKVETNGVVTVYRLCISNGGGQCYITKMMIDRYARWTNGEILS